MTKPNDKNEILSDLNLCRSIKTMPSALNILNYFIRSILLYKTTYFTECISYTCATFLLYYITDYQNWFLRFLTERI